MEINYKYAGLGRRFTALIIDYTIVGIISLPVTLWFIEYILKPQLFIGIIAGFYLLVYYPLIFLITYLIYSINPITSRWQGTLGKRITGIYVINQDGTKLTKTKMLGRSIFPYITPFMLFIILFTSFDEVILYIHIIIVIHAIVCIGFIMPAFTPKKVALHDIIFKTYVVGGKL
ncbi:RDD family protein [Candidatus Jidaibacter acanthamoebae]|nr:RDD family protein [Candidatus Jidaibacter acanthamoeba]